MRGGSARLVFQGRYDTLHQAPMLFPPYMASDLLQPIDVRSMHVEELIGVLRFIVISGFLLLLSIPKACDSSLMALQKGRMSCRAASLVVTAYV